MSNISNDAKQTVADAKAAVTTWAESVAQLQMDAARAKTPTVISMGQRLCNNSPVFCPRDFLRSGTASSIGICSAHHPANRKGRLHNRSNNVPFCRFHRLVA